MKKISVIIFVGIIIAWMGVTLYQRDTPQSQETIINYAILEKDRLYTEEEGRYPNLNETGKQFLEDVLSRPECDESSPAYSGECSNKRKLDFSSLIAVSNGYALLQFPTSKGGYYYEIYDVIQKEFVKNEVNSFDTTIRTDTLIVLVGAKELWKYKIGDSFLTKIVDSEVQKNETYFRAAGLGYAEVESTIRDSLLNVSVFSLDTTMDDETGGGLIRWKKIREVTFDLNSL